MSDESLFQSVKRPDMEPLAERMRPRSLEEFIGQDHIVGPGRLLRRAIQADRVSSLIFAGPPGTGKTTLARVIANSTSSDFNALNAVLAGVANIREAIDRAREQRDLFGRKTILFVDEVHRWNKAQQDALLPWVENGTIRLVGATTENPWFEVNAALVSRSRVFMLRPLERADLLAVARQALADPARGYGKYRIEMAADALDHLVDTCGGDARTLLNALELAVETTPEHFPPRDLSEPIRIDRRAAEDSIQKKVVLYDKEGDYHFDTISAFIKSIRGSDPDAALYWLARMVRGGEDPKYIFRRLLVSASEDIGLGDPLALPQVQSAAAAFDRVGMPEGQYFLAQATLYLALAPKSNSTLGYYDALAAQEDKAGTSPDVPVHLRDASRDKNGLGHGKGYLYPHAYRDHWVAQNYLPKELREQIFYQASDSGWESRVRAEVQARKWEQLAKAADTGEEQLSAAKADRSLSAFVRRHEAQQDASALALARAMLDLLAPTRHGRCAIGGLGGLFALPLFVERCPEGICTVLVEDHETAGLEKWLAAYMPSRDLPNWAAASWESEDPHPEFGLVWTRDALDRLLSLRNPAGTWACSFRTTRHGSRPSDLLPQGELRDAVARKEDEAFGIRTEAVDEPADLLPPDSPWTMRLASLFPREQAIILDEGRTAKWTRPESSYWRQVVRHLDEADRNSATTAWKGLHGTGQTWIQSHFIYLLDAQKRL